MIKIYGINNCDTLKKAIKWLKENNIDHHFHDYRKEGVTRELLESFEIKIGWEVLLNKRGTTWRKLEEDIKNCINRENALTLMLESPAIIKRPVLVLSDNIIVGFKAAQYKKIFSRQA